MYYPYLSTPKPCQSGVFEKSPQKPRDWDLKLGDFENVSNKTKKADYSNCHSILYPISGLCFNALLLFWE